MKMIVTRDEAKKQGLIRFFENKECRRGHFSERYTASGGCIECRSQKAKAWQSENKEKVKGYIRKYEKLSRKEKPEDYHANRKKQKREYYDEKREYFNKIKRQRYYEEKDIWAAKAKDWKSRNKDRIRFLNASYRAAKRGAAGVITVDMVSDMKKKCSEMCETCGSDISKEYHIDHKIPLSRGGSNLRENLQLLCKTCNLRKGTKTPEEFAEYMAKEEFRICN